MQSGAQEEKPRSPRKLWADSTGASTVQGRVTWRRIVCTDSPRTPRMEKSCNQKKARLRRWRWEAQVLHRPRVHRPCQSGPPPVRPQDELIREVRYVRRGSTDGSTGTPSSTRSSTMTASTRGMDAMEAPLSLGCLGRMRGQEIRGERPAPQMQVLWRRRDRTGSFRSIQKDCCLLDTRT